MTLKKAPVQKEGADQNLTPQNVKDIKTELKIVGSDNTTITDANVIENEVWLSQSEYDALGEQPTTILFHIKSDTTNEVLRSYIGKSPDETAPAQMTITDITL